MMIRFLPWTAVALLAVLSAAAGSAQTQTPKAKAAPRAAAPFDATNPQSLMDLLNEAGAKVQTSRREDDAVFVAVTSTVAAFSMQFAGCDAQGRACRAVLMDAVRPRSTATLVQLNAFNQTSVMCRLYQDRAGAPHVLYSTLLTRTMSRNDASNQLLAWQGCLADAHDFLRDPVAYLASAA
jgi:hypothetical protein